MSDDQSIFCFQLFVLIVSGSIDLRDNGDKETQVWPVHSDCELVRMRSTVFKISDEEYVKIDATQYTGRTEIDAVLSSNFTVAFHSNKIRPKKWAVLNWTCLKLGEWKPTGTCTEVNSLRPEYNGPDIKYRTKYRKTNETCSK